MRALVGVSFKNAPYTIVKGVQVWGVWGPKIRSNVAVQVLAHSVSHLLGLVGGCRVLLENIGPPLGYLVNPGLTKVTENCHIAFRIHPKSFLKEVGGHDIPLVGYNVENNDGGWKLCVHDVGYICRVLTQPPVVPLVDLLVLVKIFFIGKEPKNLGLLRMLDFSK